MAEVALVMEGTLDAGTSLGEVLAVVGISRQWMEVVLRDELAARGRILCKGGKVVAAFEAPDRSGVDAFVSLYRRPARAFEVYHRPAPAEPMEPLGTVAELVAVDVAAAERDEPVLLEGRFADTALHEVLDVVGLTRQLVELRLDDDVGTRGTVMIKAGRVLEARSARSGTTGRDAAIELLREPGESFSVTRRHDAGRREPIARLAELVALADAPPPPAPVLQGRFGETRITDLLDSVGLSRQVMEIRLSRAGRTLGRILVREGKLIDVERGGLRGRDAFRAILDDPGTLYRVSRHDGDEPVEPLGTVAEWVRAPVPPVRELLLEGTFADATIAEVLATFSLTRQHVVALFRAGGKTRGRLALKAGRVLEAEHRGRRGVDAFRALLLDPGEGFVVYRMPPGSPVPEPLGRLQDLLAEPPADFDDAPPTVVIGASYAEDAPTTVGELPPETIDLSLPQAESPLELRLRELTDAVVALERAYAASSAHPPWNFERAFLLSLGLAQLVALFAAVVMLARVLGA